MSCRRAGWTHVTKTPVVGFGGTELHGGVTEDAVAALAAPANRTVQVTVVPMGASETAKASATRPGWKTVGCPRPGPPGCTALSVPTAIVRSTTFSLS